MHNHLNGLQVLLTIELQYIRTAAPTLLLKKCSRNPSIHSSMPKMRSQFASLWSLLKSVFVSNSLLLGLHSTTATAQRCFLSTTTSIPSTMKVTSNPYPSTFTDWNTTGRRVLTMVHHFSNNSAHYVYKWNHS